MSKGIEIKIEGLTDLENILKELPDKVKKNEVNKVLNQVVDPLYQMMKSLTPISSGFKNNKSGSYRIKKRQVGKTIINETYTPGYGKITIAKKKLNKARNPLISVGPHTRKGKDGYYLRQWVIPGTKYFTGNDFVENARKATEGVILPRAEIKIAKYVQKQIDKLISK